MEPIYYIDRATGEQRTERPPGEGFLRFLYHRPLGELALQTLVKRRLLSHLYGQRMHAATSRRQIVPFIKAHQVDASEFLLPTASFKSFNDFFIRKLKPGARPIGEGLVSPADGKLLAFQNLAALQGFFVKGLRFTLPNFLQDDALAEKHSDSSLLIIRLAPPDYHRFHFPYPGIPAAPHPIRGRYYSVSPYATRKNFGRVFGENERSYTLLQTEKQGQIVIAPVGATMVGSIMHTYVPGQAVSKGQEMGYFAFGGSCLILLLEKGQFTLDEDLLTHTAAGLETTVKMGERIGQLT